MSVERVRRKSGTVWRVRWHENGQPRSRVMGSKRDAELFKADLTRCKGLGSSRRSTPATRPSPSSPASGIG